MKKFLLEFVLFTLIAISAFGQDQPNDNKNKGDQNIKALYVAYMTDQLNLNENEAQRFWPVHKEYNKELKAIHKETLPELDLEEATLNIKKKYRERFFKILGNERTELFYKKDREFKDKLIKKLREKRMGEHNKKKDGEDQNKPK